MRIIWRKDGLDRVQTKETYCLVTSWYWIEARWPFPGIGLLHLAGGFGHDDTAHFHSAEARMPIQPVPKILGAPSSSLYHFPGH